MPIYDYSQIEAISDCFLGLRVDKAAAAITNTTNNLFYVVGGRVLLTGFLGEVVTTMDATVTNLLFRHTVTGVTTPTATALSIDSASLANLAPGRMLTLPEAVGGATVVSVGSSAALFPKVRYVLPVGILAAVAGGADANAGTIKWSAWYFPVDTGAYMTAV